MSTITNTKHRRLIQELEVTHEGDGIAPTCILVIMELPK